MKNFWTFCVGLELLLLSLTLAAAPAAAKRKPTNPVDLTNFLLSPEYSRWLVGPIAEIATAKEIETYLGLQLDQEARAFIEGFWEKRGGVSLIPGQGPKATFDARVQEADRLFDDGFDKGHRTDRGTVYVLFGEPAEIRFEPAPRGRGEFLEIWEYPKSADKGLSGEKPDRFYRFVKRDGRTVTYRGPTGRQLGRPPIRR